jgi:hypothetical protein
MSRTAEGDGRGGMARIGLARLTSQSRCRTLTRIRFHPKPIYSFYYVHGVQIYIRASYLTVYPHSPPSHLSSAFLFLQSPLPPLSSSSLLASAVDSSLLPG